MLHLLSARVKYSTFYAKCVNFSTLEFCPKKEMEIRSGRNCILQIGYWILRMLVEIPISGVEGFGEAEIECQLGNDLPAKANVSATSETINGRNRIGIEYIVLIGINAVVPIARIEELQAETEAQWTLDTGHRRLEIVGYVLEETYTIGDW